MSVRLFVAVDVPETHLDALAQLQTPDLDARWTPRGQHHLTLRFIGDVGEEQVEAITAALAQVAAAPLTLEAAGLDALPSRRRPRVIVVPVGADPQLERLHLSVEAALSRLDIPADPKPFLPHITVGRLKRASAQDVRRYLRTHAGFRLPAWEVRTLTLYRSTLRPEGAVHEQLASFALGTP